MPANAVVTQPARLNTHKSQPIVKIVNNVPMPKVKIKDKEPKSAFFGYVVGVGMGVVLGVLGTFGIGWVILNKGDIFCKEE
jgi:hypothetical protein